MASTCQHCSEHSTIMIFEKKLTSKENSFSKKSLQHGMGFPRKKKSPRYKQELVTDV
jgi:hypothetical protein